MCTHSFLSVVLQLFSYFTLSGPVYLYRWPHNITTLSSTCPTLYRHAHYQVKQDNYRTRDQIYVIHMLNHVHTLNHRLHTLNHVSIRFIYNGPCPHGSHRVHTVDVAYIFKRVGHVTSIYHYYNWLQGLLLVGPSLDRANIHYTYSVGSRVEHN